MINENRFMAIARKAMSNKTPLQVEISVAQAWQLVSALQLTTRHPRLGDRLKANITEIGKLFQSAIVEAHPETQEVLEMGWDSQYDVEEK